MTFRHLLVLVVFSFYWLSPRNSFAQNYTVLNDASIYSGCNCYRLTPDQNNEGGGVYQNNTINLNNSFDYTFNVFLGCNDAGADGIVFILTNNITGIGASGGGLGYAGLPGNSLAIEYDTYQNSQDPAYDHIAMESGGSVNHNVMAPVPANASSANIEDCAYHTTEIIWNVNTQTYSVYFDGSLRMTYTGNIVATFFGGNPVVNWGWSGSTGGATNDQRFCITNISSWTAGTNYQSCSNTMAFHDISTTNVGSVQSWAWNFGEPSSGASNTSTLQNPSHTYAAPGTYTVSLTITDITGCATTYSHTVTINAPITISPNLVSPLCNGGNNGSIYLTPTGGFGTSAGYGGYIYNWSNNASNPTSQSTGLTAGTYNVTVSDGVCSATGSYSLTQPAALTATTTHTDANCGASNGSVSITISGGVQPYTGVNWNLVAASGSGSGPYTRINIPAATYVADFHDANGCSAALTYREVVASLPCGYSVTSSSTNVNCFGASTGTATVVVTAPAGTTQTISWTNSGGTTVSNSGTATNLPAGTYTYHYSDNHGQTFTGTVVVNQPGAAMVANITTTNATCSYLNNGSAVASVTANGTPAYNYSWSRAGQTNSPTATNLAPGAVSVNITDANGCTATASGTIGTQPVLNASITGVINDSCYLAKKGSATVTASGGTPVYSYQWNNSPTAIGSSNYGIGAGNYTVTVTDNNGCTAVASTSLTQPAQMTETMSHVNIACFGGSGSATITPAGGNGGYTYAWSAAGVTTGTYSPITVAGTYYVTVTDSKLCTVNDSATITAPTAAFTVTETHVNVKCKGAPTGSITLTLAGGTTPYNTVTWNGGATGTTRTNLVAGTYSYTATDANSCQATGSVTITEPTSAFTVTETHVNVLCFGASTGSITLTQAGGTTPYATPQWLDLALGATRSNLPAGTYSYGDSDNNGCIVTGTVIITQPAAAFTVTETHTDVLCHGGTTGSITLTESGGTTPYNTVTWSGGATGLTRTNLAAGSYSYSATDANNCQATGTITITEPATAFAVTETHVNVKCNGGTTGSITLTESGGTTPYGTVTWTDGPTGTSRTGLAAGSYTYNATDANGCAATATITITQPTTPFTVTETHVNVLCFGASTGSITLTQAGGTTPYATPQWLDGAIGLTRTNLPAGTYSYGDSDKNGCIVTGSVIITQPAAAFTVTETHVDVLCHGGTTGSITLTQAGGTTPYNTVTWSGGATGLTRTNLAAGSYSYTATDANNCQATGTITIAEPATAFTVTETHVNVKCNGGTTGSITLTESGGTTPYGTVTWTDGPTGTSRTGLAAGNYTYNATDANGCAATGTITITQPTSAFTVTETHVNVLCFGASTGSIALTQAGGTTPYATPQWLDGAIGLTRTNLPAGTYSYGDSDNNGCIVTGSVIITQPTSAFTVTETHTDVLCHGGTTGSITLSESGGTTAYNTVTWSGGATGTTRTNLAAGSYSYTATDANNCQATGTIMIAEPATAFVVTETHVNVKCNGGTTGSITLTESGGTTAYSTVTWTDGPTGTSRTGLAAGSYTYNATDANGCAATGTITITQPTTPFTVTETHVNVLCFGASTGSITLTQAGGTPPYATPLWLDLAVGTTRSNLPAGTYSYGDSDNNGCIVTGTVIITQPASALTVTETHTDVLCHGGSTGTITLSESGGTGPYSTIWTGGVIGVSRTNLAAGSYGYTVTDANNCQTTGTVTIAEPATAFTVTEVHTNVKCMGGASGTITLTESGGTTPYGTVTWTDGPTGTLRTGLVAGSYTYNATDANGCAATGTITITEPTSAFSVSETHVDVLCFGNNTGSITLSQTGGTTPYYTPAWLDGATGASRTNLLAGTYSYVDSDANGCVVSGSVTITQPATGGMTVTITEIDATCSYNNDGSATASTAGGVSPYNYHWSNAFQENGVATSTATGLAAITYTVTVTDQNTCTALGTTTIGSQPRLTAQLTVTDVNCYGGTTGAINVTAGGGVGGFHYAWSVSAATGDQPTASNLAAATYNVSITDGNGCELDTFATVTQPGSALTFATPVFVKNVSCNGGNDGEIKYVTSGGTSPYVFTWSGTAAGSNDSAVNLIAGSYDVTITDAKSCTVTNTAVVTEPTALVISSQTQTNVLCHGDQNGTATINVTGGTPGGYTYAWTPNVGSANSVSSLAAGTYTVTVKDPNQCSITASFTITEPQIISTPFTQVNVLCHGDATGSITINPTGGTPASTGYVYTWNPNVSSTNTATTLVAKTYTIVVTDSNNCTASQSVQITEPSALTITATPTSVSCSRDSNGQIQVVAGGGTGPYQYALSPDGVTYGASNGSGLFTGLRIGTYTGRATDANGCTITATATITAPDSVTVTTVLDPVKCYGESNGAITITSTGGTPGYTYDFSNGVSNTTGSAPSLVAGSYGFTVTDARGCAQTYNVTIIQPDSLTIAVTPADPTIDLGETVNLQATSNATSPVTYTWSPADGLSNTDGSNTTVTTNNSRTYTLTGVIDPYGEDCKATIQVHVTVSPNYNIFVPNAFTPNSDGINDYFEIYGKNDKKNFKFVEVAVFDRWGEKVFQSNDINFAWDGTYKGKLVEPGTFAYTISIVFIDNHSESNKGTITVIR